MSDTLTFPLKENANPEEVLSLLEAADSNQEFNLSTSQGTLRISSQIGQNSDDVRKFVQQTVGDLVSDAA